MSQQVTAWSLDRALFDFEKRGEIYRDGWKGLEAARSIPDNIYAVEPFNVHFYWRVGREFGRKQVLPLKAALVTQGLGARIHLWSNVDLTENEYFKPIARHIHFHIYDPVTEAVGTPLEGMTRVLLANDHLSWLDGDLFRLLVLYKHGGIYVDMDCVLLRPLDPLTGTDFMYQWGTELDKMNGAVMGMRRGSLLGRIALGFLPHVPAAPASTDWGTTLYGAVRQVYREWVVFPCAFFNTEWQVGWNMSESAHPFRHNPEQSVEMFDGAFAWHWHNKWDDPIEPGCKFERLEMRANARYAGMWDFKVDKEKRHVGGNYGGGDPATYTPKLWAWLIERFDVTSVFDVGCGEGHAIKWFRDHDVPATGIDGLAENIKCCPGGCHLHDLTEEAAICECDLVWCCEVVEHIEEKYLPNLLASLASGKYVAMTFAPPGQAGYHHVNCQENGYWIRALASIGYELLPGDTEEAREIAEDGWFKRHGLIFQRRVE